MKAKNSGSKIARNVTSYVTADGEVHDGVPVILPRRKKNGFGKDWIAVNQLALEQALRDRKELGNEALIVFMAFLARSKFNNEPIGMNQADLSSLIGMKRSNVSRSIKRLIDAGLLIEHKREGLNKRYTVSCEVSWKGDGENHVVALANERIDTLRKCKVAKGPVG